MLRELPMLKNGNTPFLNNLAFVTRKKRKGP